MRLYQHGQKEALIKLGLDRPRHLAGDESEVLNHPGIQHKTKDRLYNQYLKDVGGHEIAPREDYTSRGKTVGGITGGIGGGALGALAGATSRGGNLKRSLISAAAGGGLGALGGSAIGKAVGEGQYTDDTERVNDAQEQLEDEDRGQMMMARVIAQHQQRQRAMQEMMQERRHQEMMYGLRQRREY